MIAFLATLNAVVLAQVVALPSARSLLVGSLLVVALSFGEHFVPRWWARLLSPRITWWALALPGAGAVLVQAWPAFGTLLVMAVHLFLVRVRVWPSLRA